jgi:hypothetical protein
VPRASAADEAMVPMTTPSLPAGSDYIEDSPRRRGDVDAERAWRAHAVA